jgi:hypothetical protein
LEAVGEEEYHYRRSERGINSSCIHAQEQSSDARQLSRAGKA